MKTKYRECIEVTVSETVGEKRDGGSREQEEKASKIVAEKKEETDREVVQSRKLIDRINNECKKEEKDTEYKNKRELMQKIVEDEICSL